ncbi:MAG: hypothetical protein KF730_08190 [Sphingomonas sp.]|uniref:hypothetical protein n=1 Tax=Sphingomonas sp. TaxID=28214 RepID=UPI0025FBD88B|nr:hypothetical protein [Sphingomonas sp.]MBX3564540.1 hypothetical protein [Sphingomonas sp.]
MSSFREQMLKALRRNRTQLIVFGIIFGLGLRHFLGALWETWSLNSAWATWLEKGLSDIPATMLMLIVCFSIGMAWEARDQLEKEDVEARRPDGYRPGNWSERND